MNVDVVVFARVKDLMGAERIELVLAENATVASLKKELLKRHPELSDLLPHCAISIDHEYSQDDSTLVDGCEVGVIPPVSGG